jgi:hypothetical protein
MLQKTNILQLEILLYDEFFKRLIDFKNQQKQEVNL